MQKIKSVYIVWFEYYQKLDKTHKYTLGKRIDDLFIETIEAVAVATFLDRTEKQPWIKFAIRKLDTIKILLMILWETKSIDNKKYIHISKPIEEIGKMLGGWNGQLTKQNSLK
jgi:hypothetical protein